MNASNFIDAIRIIRNLPVVIEETKSENGTAIQRVKVGISLLEVKKLVESIMALNGDNLGKLREANETITMLRNSNDRLQKALDTCDGRYYELRAKIRGTIDAEF